ncbi:MAG: MFS transporter [Anaerolineales bacterium]|jgi:MFS family permease|nr:MFS transporter [Anaerolineales bacterium]
MKAKKAPILTTTLMVLLFSMIVANIGGQMYGPLLPLYVQELGADINQIGIFFTLAMIAPLLFQILGGWLSDAIGRVQAMAIGSVAGLAGYLVFAFAPSWQWLLLAMVGMSMAGSFVGPSFQALVAEESPEASRGKVFGIVQGLFLIVGVIGAPLGGYLADNFGFRLMFTVAAVLYGLATFIRLFMARKIRQMQTAPAEKPSFAHLKNSLISIFGLLTAGGVVTWIFLSDGVGDVTFSLVGNLFPIYLNNIVGISMTELGILGAISALASMAFMVAGGALSDKFGERVGIVLGNLLLGGAILVMLNVQTFALFAIAWILLGVGQALVGPAYSSLISKVVPQKLRGTAFGLFSTSLGILSLPAPYIGVQLWERFGPKIPFYVPLIAMLFMLPVIWVKFRLPKTPAPEAEATPEG